MVCDDGSKASEEAVQTVCKGMLRDIDKLIVAHAWSRDKEEYLPAHLKKDWIKDQRSSEFISLMDRFLFRDEEIKPDKEDETAKNVLTNLSKELLADITVCGFHGRKGKKEDPTVMGSSVFFMSMHTFTPMMIVKKQILRSERPNGYNFGLCCDGSLKSMKALTLMCQMRSPQDKIHVLICEQANINCAYVKRLVEDALEENGCE